MSSSPATLSVNNQQANQSQHPISSHDFRPFLSLYSLYHRLSDPYSQICKNLAYFNVFVPHICSSSNLRERDSNFLVSSFRFLNQFLVGKFFRLIGCFFLFDLLSDLPTNLRDLVSRSWFCLIKFFFIVLLTSYWICVFLFVAGGFIVRSSKIIYVQNRFGVIHISQYVFSISNNKMCVLTYIVVFSSFWVYDLQGKKTKDTCIGFRCDVHPLIFQVDINICKVCRNSIIRRVTPGRSVQSVF